MIEGSGVLAYIQHDPVEARRLIDAGVELWRTVDNDARLCFALAYRGLLARQSGDPVTARASCEEALTYSFLEPHLRTGHRLALSQLGYLAEAEDDRATARRLQEESLRVARGLSAMDLAIQLNNVAVVTLRMGDMNGADGYFREALALSRDIAAA